MTSKIRFSRGAVALTAIILLVLYGGCIATVKELPAFITLLAILIILMVCGGYFGAWKITATPENVIMKSLLKSRKIPMAEIESVESFQPPKGAIRLCASDGFMGYWGIFQAGEIGRYYGFYGNLADCFLIKMKNGSKYLLGCETPEAMVAYIKSRL